MSKEKVAAAIAKAQAEMEEALVELEAMPAFDPGSVAFAAHALNNYLAVTEGTVDLLLFSLRDHPDPQIRAWLSGLHQAADLMNHTVNQLLTTSARPAAKLKFEKVDLAALAQRACNYYRTPAYRKQIIIVFDAAPDAPAVWADRVVLAAVLDNLLSNAVKYSEPGKRIRVNVRGDADGGGVCAIQDEGPGLNAEDQARLFQRGVKLGPRPTAGEPSSGYGLAVAKDLMDRLGGRLWCESRPGEGTCFSLSVPACREEVQAAGQGLQSAAAPGL